MFSCELSIYGDETYRGIYVVMMSVSFRLIEQRCRQDRKERRSFVHDNRI